ncbi:MAG: hypothetical protein LW832_02405 [Parachlamydia sp.]|jgi:hypothetical protein|nr:hypothetical protein [Parachlamydia sp.]
MKNFILIILFFAFHPLQSELCLEQIYAGPELYGIWRKKEGGVKQEGFACGLRCGYERQEPWNIYAGVELFYGRSQLKGEFGDCHLKSNYSDWNLEERVGFSFAAPFAFLPQLTPFIGYGRMWEKNNYVKPSPSLFHFKNDYTYIPLGFLSSIQWSPCLTIGLNMKARFILDGKNFVSHDPQYGRNVQCYDEKVQYRIELPICYRAEVMEGKFKLEAIPFYEFRHYGKRANFPFDFLETRFSYAGATLQLDYLF